MLIRCPVCAAESRHRPQREYHSDCCCAGKLTLEITPIDFGQGKKAAHSGAGKPSQPPPPGSRIDEFPLYRGPYREEPLPYESMFWVVQTRQRIEGVARTVQSFDMHEASSEGLWRPSTSIWEHPPKWFAVGLFTG